MILLITMLASSFQFIIYFFLFFILLEIIDHLAYSIHFQCQAEKNLLISFLVSCIICQTQLLFL